MKHRKIVALGQSSRVITLPKTWLKLSKLDKGDLVSLHIQPDGSLMIHPVADVMGDARKIRLDVGSDEIEDSIVRRIIGSRFYARAVERSSLLPT